MKCKLGVFLIVAGALLTWIPTTWAHVSYTGRDLLVNGTATGNTYTLSGQRVTSNYGWADAADADWGDSHRGRFLKFTLAEPSQVTLQVEAQGGVTFVSGGVEMTALADLIPGFSVYQGLVPQSSHESSDHPTFLANHPGYLPGTEYYNAAREGDKEGAWRSTADFYMGTVLAEMADPALWNAKQVKFLDWRLDGAGVDLNGDGAIDLVGDAQLDGIARGSWTLPAGDYTVVVGGACYDCQAPTNPTVLDQRAFTATLTVAAVPEPASAALLALGSLLLLGLRRTNAAR